MVTRNQQKFTPATLAPDLLRRQMEMQRNKMMAEQLLKSEAPQGQMVSGHYVAPSITQHLAHALRQYQGNKAMNDLPQQAADIQQAQRQQEWQQFNSVFGDGQGQGGQAGGFASPADAQREFMIAQLMGMDKYAAERMRWQSPTNEQKNLAFLPENVRNQAIMAPFVNEMNQDGVQNVLGPNGQVQAFAVPGYSDIQAQQAGAVAGAQAGAQAQHDLVAVPDGRGGTVMMPRSQAVNQLGGGGAAMPQGVSPGQGGQFGRAPSAGEQSYDTAMGTRFATQYDNLQSGAANARDMLGMYDLAEQALNSGVRTGIGAEAELTLRQLGAAMGMDTNPEKVSGGELIRAVQNRMALIMRNPEGGMGMPGAISDRDIKFLKDSQIGIDRTPEGNRQMLQAFRAIEQRKVQVAELADQYVQQHGRLDAGFNRVVRDYADANPLFAATEPEQRLQELDNILGL